MGLADMQAGLMMLTRYKSDLEFGLRMNSQKRTILASVAMQAAENEGLSEQLHYQDKVLELEGKRLEIQHKIVSSEVESVKKIVDDRAKKDFKYA